MKDDLRYTPSDCFETFPFPPEFEGECGAGGGRAGVLRVPRRAYGRPGGPRPADGRPTARGPHQDLQPLPRPGRDLARHRRSSARLHAAMDRAVLDAYGWTDLPTATCEFLLDYEDDEEDDDRRRAAARKPWRYRWPDDVRDEVLARLLELNANRAEQERLAGLQAASKPGGKSPRKTGRQMRSDPAQETLL